MKIIYLIACFILIKETLSGLTITMFILLEFFIMILFLTDLVCDSIGKLCLNGGKYDLIILKKY